MPTPDATPSPSPKPSPAPSPAPSPGPAAISTAETIAAVLIANGFSRSSTITGTAIVLAESSGDPNITHDNRPDGGLGVDRGWWQINDYWHPEVSDACAFDPICATRAAFKISAGGTVWFQWSTWKNGTHRAHLDEARAAVDKVTADDGGLLPEFSDIADLLGKLGPGGVLLPDGIDVPNPLAAIGKIADALFNVETWIRILEVAGGGALIFLGIVIVAKETPIGDAALAAATRGASEVVGGD